MSVQKSKELNICPYFVMHMFSDLYTVPACIFSLQKRRRMFWICLCKGQRCAQKQGDLDYKSHPRDLKTIECLPLGTCLTAQLANVFLLF